MKKSLLLSLAIAVSAAPVASTMCAANQTQAAPMAIDPLVLAAAQGTENDIHEVIAGNPKTKSDEQKMASALIVAIACQNKDGIRTLLDLGANPNIGIEATGQQDDHWAVTEAMSNVVRTAHAIDTKQDGMALEQGADGKATTRSVPKTDAQRAQEFAKAKDLFEIVIGHSNTDLCRKTSAGLTIYTLIHISQMAAVEMEGFPKTVEAVHYLKGALEQELIKRKIKPEALLKDIPQEITRALKAFETQNEKRK